MSFFQKFTTQNLYEIMGETIKKYSEAEDKDEQCDPAAPLTILINGKKHYVLSVGGDPKVDGLIFEAKPASWWK